MFPSIKGLLNVLLAPREVWQNTGPNKSKRRPSPPLFSRFFVSPFFVPWHGDRRWYHCPGSQRSPLRGVFAGVLRACRGDGTRWRHHSLSVLARGQLPSPRGPPRHHRTKMEGRDPPVSGECPAPSQNQPAVGGSLKPVVCGEIDAAVRGQRKPAAIRGSPKPAVRGEIAAIRGSLKPAVRGEMNAAVRGSLMPAGRPCGKPACSPWLKPRARSSAGASKALSCACASRAPPRARFPSVRASRAPPRARFPSVRASRAPPRARFPSVRASRAPPRARFPSVRASRAPPRARFPSVRASRAPPRARFPSVRASRAPPRACFPSVRASRAPPRARFPSVRASRAPPRARFPSVRASRAPPRACFPSVHASRAPPSACASRAPPSARSSPYFPQGKIFGGRRALAVEGGGRSLGGGSAMAARAPWSAVGPRTGAALEAFCPRTLPLEASRATTPPPRWMVYSAGRAVREGGVMSDLCFPPSYAHIWSSCSCPRSVLSLISVCVWLLLTCFSSPRLIPQYSWALVFPVSDVRYCLSKPCVPCSLQ